MSDLKIQPIGSVDAYVSSRVAELEKQNTELQKQIQELQAHVERLRSEFALFDDAGLCEHKHHCEFTLLQERKRLHHLLSETPAQSLGALKAQWQAEAIRDRWLSEINKLRTQGAE